MKSALVIGASRGIGRQIAITLSQNGYKVGVAAKTSQHTEKLPGTIYSVTDEIKQQGGVAFPIICNARDMEQVDKAVKTTIAEFGNLDCVIYNAGAILWEKVIDTSMKQYDLMTDINARAPYALVQTVLPYFLQKKSGKILMVSPPIYSRFLKGKTPYAMSKIGQTVLVLGLANELVGTGVTISTLWPATAIESFVTVKHGAPPGVMRKATIFADAALKIVQEPSEKYNGEALLDEDMLRDAGVSDFSQYRCDPDTEPPRMMPKKLPSLEVEEQNVVFPKL